MPSSTQHCYFRPNLFPLPSLVILSSERPKNEPPTKLSPDTAQDSKLDHFCFAPPILSVLNHFHFIVFHVSAWLKLRRKNSHKLPKGAFVAKIISLDVAYSKKIDYFIVNRAWLRLQMSNFSANYEEF